MNKITKSKAISMLVEVKRYDALSRDALIEILRDSDQSYYEVLDKEQLQLELVVRFAERFDVVDD